ncbi:hypothetical protein HID58_080725 [Brassica napus]|uniref:Uncharacterized protein n=1 Tax=Brassica napus TaxID=3708 RepID=A0ABQ7Y5P3_BRANA|nr:hypothetical protein HID58_080725 [Brassica napus]
MVRTKNMAKRDIVVTSWTHAEGESSRPHLTNEGSEATPPRKDLLSTALFPEITEELDKFNTVREKELSEESNDQHTSSVHEEVQIDKVTATSSDPASPKPLSAPIETVPSESPRSEAKEQSPDNPEQVEKTHEDAQNAGVVSLGSSSTEISEKQERKKRVMKRLGLGSSKRRKTCKSGALNAASGSQVIPLNTSVSSRVRSRKAPERGTVGENSPVKKRVEQFLRWSIIVERLVDMKEKDQWVYVKIIAKGPVAYTKDKRFGEIYEQRVAKAKSKAKEVGEGKLSSRSTRMPPPVPSPSIAPASSNRTGPRRFIVHDLGSVSIPQGLLTHEDLQAVLQQTTRALQALTDIICEFVLGCFLFLCIVCYFISGTCETRGLKKGRLKMYGQDGAVVVHETRHELRHQTKIQELFESVKEH